MRCRSHGKPKLLKVLRERAPSADGRHVVPPRSTVLFFDDQAENIESCKSRGYARCAPRTAARADPPVSGMSRACSRARSTGGALAWARVWRACAACHVPDGLTRQALLAAGARSYSVKKPPSLWVLARVAATMRVASARAKDRRHERRRVEEASSAPRLSASGEQQV